MKTYVYSQERSAIAALSLVVDMCADAGDDSAIKILNNAASHLIGLITRMENSLSRDSLPIKFTGGISGSKLLYYELEKFLKSVFQFQRLILPQEQPNFLRNLLSRVENS